MGDGEIVEEDIEKRFDLPGHGGMCYTDNVRRLAKVLRQEDLMPHSKFQPRTKKTIIQALRNGVPHAKAAEVAGVSVSIFRLWLSAGRRQLDEEGNAVGIYGEFLLDCQAAEAQGVQSRLGRIEEIANKTNRWEGIAWMLERRFPEEFGRPYNSSGNDVKHASSQNIKITVVHTNDWRDLEKVKAIEGDIIDTEFAAENETGDTDILAIAPYGAEGSDASGETE